MKNKKETSNIYIGTSGWSYPHWAKGVFYPKSVPTQNWLIYYASIFNAVEVNSTFYRLPNPSLLKKWLDITPTNFMFSIKIWRRISHDLRLKNVHKEIDDFYQSVLPLQEKIKVYLLQTPPSFIPDINLLDEFLCAWSERFTNSLLAVELRNKKCFHEEIFNVMSKHNVSLCLEDYKGCEIDDVITANWIYIRKHGSTGRYQGEYTQQQLKSEAEKIKQWVTESKEVFIFFNNDFGGYAPKNALQLIEFIKNIKRM
ncbi:MAG TPA: DUF72 domain-containing protein [Candidatus Hydrogenedens sp.]|mgnify:CR=1 FL=1|nr:DUF72 domain-containing protein [Candidatus Hydrogenedens sp.]HOL20357.1 DUF72 domain-containing protein [Candidatus Hydrogenedens sp.]HPP59995.1 DUF72 domain-containing protein [Candidatus Hydrogenedens sp.]